MLSLDISRDSFQRAKNYSGLRQQQGRIPLDSELNEGSDILAEELRRAIQEVICASGTPNDGFRIRFPDAASIAAYDPTIDAGSYYVGGLRYDMLPTSTFLTQPDWLQITLDLAPPPARPANQVGGPVRHDVAYLEAWEQEVSATEDSELFERALAGADGAGRRRRMARVQIVTDTADTCDQALDDLFPAANFDPVTHGLVTGAGLTVDFDNDTVDDNLCAPQVQTGFLGAENETFRVQLTGPNRFIWGRDNASALYRVTIALEPGDPTANPPVPDRTRVTFLTRPRDAHAQPLAGQAVELLRWNTLLPNGEKLAQPTGTLANIAADYDPGAGTLLIDHVPDPAWTAWFSGEGAGAINPLDRGLDDEYFFLRVWTGGSGDAAQPDHPIPDSNPIALTGTGLTVAFAATGAPNVFGIAGDFWVVAARPNAPDVVTPWRLLDLSPETPPAAPPTGPLRHLAPLAIITWTPDTAGAYQPTLHDCRERFRKLCHVEDCCEITVGDGEHSHGDVETIGEALARLPAEGGKICLLCGHHEASVSIEDRVNITFSGCGADTVWTALPGDPAVKLTGCTGIRFTNFVMQAEETDIVLGGSKTGETPAGEGNSDIRFDEVTLIGRDHSAIWLNGSDRVRIERCIVAMQALSVGREQDPTAGQDPAIFLLGGDLLVERCTIGPEGQRTGDTLPLCGIQIGGASKDITIRRNRILGGKGNGVSLGHLEWVTELVPGATGPWTFGTGWYVNAAGCLVPFIYPIPPEIGIDEVLTPMSGGEIRNLVIGDNEIADMGLNGIAVCHFFDLETTEDYIALSDARITRNLIHGCVTSDLAPPPPEVAFFMSYGGIALAACDLIVIEENVIRDNAAQTTTPNCGVFILTGSGIVIEGNRIYGNGAPPLRETLPLGRRGGVNIGWCLTHAAPRGDGRSTPERMAALTMHGNHVDSSHGAALKVIALGPVRVTDNRLIGAGGEQLPILQLIGLLLNIVPVATSLGLALTSIAVSPSISRQSFANAGALLAELIIAAMGGGAVSIFNAAWLEELAEFFSSEDESGLMMVGGETLFNDNQVSLLPHGAQRGARVSSVLVASLDDVSVASNQMEIEPGGFVLTDCFAPSATVRMIGNRMQEPLLRALFSGVAHGIVFCDQSLNQGTMCFAATSLFGFGLPHVAKNANQSMIDLFPIIDGGFCGLLTRTLAGLLKQAGVGDDTDTGDAKWTNAPNYVLGGYPVAQGFTSTLRG